MNPHASGLSLSPAGLRKIFTPWDSIVHLYGLSGVSFPLKDACLQHILTLWSVLERCASLFRSCPLSFTHHLGTGGVPLVSLPPLPIKAVEDDKLGDVEAGELLPSPLGLYAVKDHGT